MSNGSKHFGGKGSKQRPTDPSNPTAYQDNWEKIFGNKKESTEDFTDRARPDGLVWEKNNETKNK
jgi:hypothetical protein